MIQPHNLRDKCVLKVAKRIFAGLLGFSFIMYAK